MVLPFIRIENERNKEEKLQKTFFILKIKFFFECKKTTAIVH